MASKFVHNLRKCLFGTLIFHMSTINVAAGDPLKMCKLGGFSISHSICGALKKPIELNSQSAQMSVHVRKVKRSKYHCRMSEMVKDRTRGLEFAVGKEDPIGSVIEFSSIYSSLFSREVERSIAVALFSVRLQSCKNSEKALLIVSGAASGNIYSLTLDCDPKKIYLLLDIHDICSAKIDYALINGIDKMSDIDQKNIKYIYIGEYKIEGKEHEREMDSTRNRYFDIKR